jgi:hypothetical protein
MNLYFHSFLIGAFSKSERYNPVNQHYLDRPGMTALLFAVDRKACNKADSVCQDMTGIEEISSIKKFTHVLASWLATMRFETKSI